MQLVCSGDSERMAYPFREYRLVSDIQYLFRCALQDRLYILVRDKKYLSFFVFVLGNRFVGWDSKSLSPLEDIPDRPAWAPLRIFIILVVFNGLTIISVFLVSPGNLSICNACHCLAVGVY